MAEILNSEPADSFYWASEVTAYDIGVNSVASSNDIKRIGYRVYSQDVGGGNNLPMMPIKGREVIGINDNVEFDATPIVKNNLGITVPDLDGSATAIEVVDFVKEFYVDYSEITIDKATGTPTTNTSSSTTKKMLNAYVQDYQSITKGTQHVLTDKDYVCIYDDVHDWILTFGNYDVTFTYYMRDGSTSTQNFVDAAATDKAYLVPSGPAQLTVPADTYKYKAVFTTGETIWYALKTPECDPNKRVDVYFLEPKGSWSPMTFECVQEESLNREFSNIAKSGLLSNDTATIFKNYGRGFVGHRSWQSLSLKKMIQSFDENLEYYRAFANAREYRAAYRSSEGTKNQLIAPLIPANQSIPINSKKDFFDFKFEAFYGIDL